MDTIDTILYALIGILGTGIVGLTLTIVFYARKFNWQFNVKDLVNGRVINRRTRAREIHKFGVPMLKVLKYGRYPCPMPPPEAIEVSPKGKKCVTAYFSDGQFIFNQDNIAIIDDKNIDKKLISEEDKATWKFSKFLWPKKLKGVVGAIGTHTYTKEFVKTDKGMIDLEEWIKLDLKEQKELFKEGNIPKELPTELREFKASKWIFSKEYKGAIRVIEPFTTEQREILVSQVAKAKEDKGKSWQETAMTIAAVGFCVFILIIAFLFYSSWVENKVEVYDKEMEILDKQQDISNSLGQATSRWAQLLGDDELDLTKRNNKEPPN